METDRGLITVDCAPLDHKYFSNACNANNNSFLTTLNYELNILRTSLPAGIWIKHYEDHIQLLSAMIKGPDKTIYENSVFLFDIYLPNGYPNIPPIVHFHSSSKVKINPNLYVNGLVCLSLLGTWRGDASESWSNKSTLLQVFVSIQSLVLVKEPYYNEPGTAVNFIKSKDYNTFIFYYVVEGQIKMFKNAPSTFSKEVKTYILSARGKIVNMILKWMRNDAKFRNDYIINNCGLHNDLYTLCIAFENLK